MGLKVSAINPVLHATRLQKLSKQLPLLSNLHDRFVKNTPSNFFRRFAYWFDESETTLRFYQQIERDLSFVPQSDWEAFASKIGEVVDYRDTRKHRDWEKLFDVFNEALGARILKEKHHCSDIHLIPRNEITTTCDWFGRASNNQFYLEVKTLNHSDAEQKSWYKEAKLTHTCFVPSSLISKAKDAYEKAKRQLDATAKDVSATKLVLFIVNVDHNFDPIDGSVRKMILDEFTRFEDADYVIHLAVNTINDD